MPITKFHMVVSYTLQSSLAVTLKIRFVDDNLQLEISHGKHPTNMKLTLLLKARYLP